MKSPSVPLKLALLGLILGCTLRKAEGFHIDMPDNLKTAAKLLHNHCVGETGVNEDLIAVSVNGNLPEDPTLACYIHCLFDSAGLIHVDTGKVRFDEVSHLFPEKHKDLIDKVTQECETVHGDNPCDTAWKTMRCYFDLDPEHTQLI